MKMEVQIISKENIKPSSRTPQHLKTFKLSLLDQFISYPYAPIVLFYAMNGSSGHLDIPKRLALLKKSLSETLTRFYPFAGKIKDEHSIECNDEGAYYVETCVNCCLDEFLSQPDLMLVHRFLPCDLINMKESTAGTYVTNVQINVFDCGGMAIGLCISHKIVDGAALSTFLKAWASTARGCEKMIYPNLAANSLLFPANDLWLRDTAMVTFGSLFAKGNCITRRFVFDASAITTLKDQATSASVKCPTRVEAVSAFIWKCTMAVSKEKNGSPRPSLLTHLVNLRRRMTPPISEFSTGNLLWIAAAQCMNADKQEVHDLAAKVRDAISKFDSDFLGKLTSFDEGNAAMCVSLKEISELGAKDEVDHFGFSSWCKLGFYETDFGWGKPLWVSSIGISSPVFMNLIILVETRSGDGIEAWLTLDEQDMAILESTSELLKFASVDPSPLAISHPEPLP